MPTLIKTNGEQRAVKPTGPRFTVPELYKLIDADIVEYVWPKHTPRVMLVVDENGWPKKRPINTAGCKLYGSDMIVGDIVVFTRAEYNRLLRHPEDPEVPELN